MSDNRNGCPYGTSSFAPYRPQKFNIKSNPRATAGRPLRVDIEFNLIAPESSFVFIGLFGQPHGQSKSIRKNYKKVLTYKIKRDIVIPYLTDRKYIKRFGGMEMNNLKRIKTQQCNWRNSRMCCSL